MSNLPLSKKRLGAVLLVLCLAGALLVLSSLILSRAYAQDSAPVATYVSGSIATDTTWTLAGSPYYIISTVSIDSGAQLTIEPGVRVIFSNKQWIHVNSGASIVAKGTPTQHITFERSGERWRKIWFHENTSSYFRYVDLAGGGSSSSGQSALIEFNGPGTHVVNNCTLQDSNHQGIAALGSGLDLTIAGTLIRDNDTFSLRVENGPNVTVIGSTFDKATNNDLVFVPASVGVATFVVTGSNFLNGATIVNEMASATCVYAQDNWWGAANGPSGGGGGACTGVGSNSGSGSALGGGVDWRNYRTSAASRVGITTTPVPSFTVSPDPSVAQPPGTDYTFDGSVSTDMEDYASSLEFCWDWEGDGGGCDATEMIATHSFSSGGWHTTNLVVTDTDGLSDSVTQNVLSGWPPTATFTITQTSWSEFEFDASASDDVEDDPADLEVRWDWEGDGVWDTGVYSVTDIVTHTYNHIGRYWPTVEVKDTEGVASTLSKPVDVIPPATPSPPVSGGGMLVSADGTVTVTWASGVISDGVVITHTAWLTAPVGGDSLPGDFTYQGFTLEATLGGQPVEQTNGAYTITVSYDLDYYGGVLGLWASADLLRLYQWSEASGEWVLVPFTVDSGQLIATTDSFGHFALVSEQAKTYLPFVLSDY